MKNLIAFDSYYIIFMLPVERTCAGASAAGPPIFKHSIHVQIVSPPAAFIIFTPLLIISLLVIRIRGKRPRRKRESRIECVSMWIMRLQKRLSLRSAPRPCVVVVVEDCRRKVIGHAPPYNTIYAWHEYGRVHFGAYRIAATGRHRYP